MSFMDRVHLSLLKDGIKYTIKKTIITLWNFRRYFVHERCNKLHGLSYIHADTAKTRIAVQIHIYYPNLTEEMIKFTNRIPFPFDCFLSTDTDEKSKEIREKFIRMSRASKIEVGVYPNRGRDVAPFLWQFGPYIHEYDFCCHLHTKYSAHDHFGNDWRHHLLSNLLPSPEHISAIINRFDSDSILGLVIPRTFWKLKPYLGWRNHQQAADKLFQRMRTKLPSCREPIFPVGNMFWARTKAILPIFECGLSVNDFHEESSQVEGTLAHCIERCWGCLVQASGYAVLRVRPF